MTALEAPAPEDPEDPEDAGEELPEDAPHPDRPDDVIRAGILTGLLGQFTPGRLIDLATGTGWFAVLAADLGWQVTAIDARHRDRDPHPQITWAEQDVRDAGLSGYDLILCLGISYHLSFGDQMALFAKCAGTPVIIDTHVALDGQTTEGDGFEGKMHGESGGLLSSWRNTRSFWPTAASLERMLRAHGYTQVVPHEPWWAPDRTFWTAIP